MVRVYHRDHAHAPHQNISRSSVGRQLLEEGSGGVEKTLAKLDAGLDAGG